MAFIAAIPEILGGVEAAAGAGEAAAGAGEAAAGAGRMGGMLRDFNDTPVGKTLGSSLGRSVVGHAVEGVAKGLSEGGGGEVGSGPNINGPVGQIRSDI